MNKEERQIMECGRRRFLKEGATLAGLAVGAIQSPAGLGQTLPSESFETDSKDFAAYGKRSRFVTSARTLGARTGR